MNDLKLHMIACGLAALAGTGASAGTDRPTVVELFTSQGCSSCPPAEALLGELAKRPDVLALAFHVDYWDYTGWRDGFELPIATQRQARYVKQLGLPMMATPQMIIDGRGEILGTNRDRLASILAVPRAAIPIHLAHVDDSLVVSIDAASGVPNSEVLLIGYRLEASTAVGAGENRGRLLKEFNIVRSYQSLGVWRGAPATWRIALKELPMDASRVAVLVQRSSQREFVGAASLAVRDIADPDSLPSNGSPGGTGP